MHARHYFHALGMGYRFDLNTVHVFKDSFTVAANR